MTDRFRVQITESVFIQEKDANEEGNLESFYLVRSPPCQLLVVVLWVLGK